MKRLEFGCYEVLISIRVVT